MDSAGGSLLVVACAEVSPQPSDQPPGQCKVTLYEHCEVPKDGWATLGEGDYHKHDLENKGVRINGLSGMKIEGPDDCTVELYDGDHFGGEKSVWRKNNTNFADGKCHNGPKNNWDFNDRTDSLKIMRSGKNV